MVLKIKCWEVLSYQREYSVIMQEIIGSQNFPLNNLTGNFTEVIKNAKKVIAENLAVVREVWKIHLNKHRVGQYPQRSKCSTVIWNNLKQFETILFPQDMIQDIYKLHWNIIHKSIGVTWNVGSNKLLRLPGHPNLKLNLT